MGTPPILHIKLLFTDDMMDSHKYSIESFGTCNQWRRKCVFWIKSSSLCDHPNPQRLLTIQLDQLENPGENKSHANPANGQKLVSNTTSQIKLVNRVLS